jgi:polysaccharide pyruvyl transferase CsaB
MACIAENAGPSRTHPGGRTDALPETVLIAGYYGRRNAGDEAILGGMLAELRAARRSLRFRVVSWDPEGTRRLHGVDAVPWGEPDRLVQVVDESSLVLVGGGGLFHDYWGVDAASLLTSRQAGIAQYGAPILLAKLSGKPSMLYAVGVGPLESPEARELTRGLFELADVATVRDAASRRLLGDLGCRVEGVEVVPDPAFHLPVSPAGAEAIAFLDRLPRPILGVAVRPWPFAAAPGEWQTEVAAAIDAHLAERGGTALFVPLQDGGSLIEDDVRAGREVGDRMSRASQAAQAPDGLDPLQRIRVLEACDLVLGMRMHAVVSALRGGIPVVGLAYDPKVAALLEAEGAGRQCLEPGAWRGERIAAALAHASRAGGERLPSGGGRPPAAKSAEIALTLLDRGPRAVPARDAVVYRVALEKVSTVVRLEGEARARAEEIERLTRWMAQQGEAIARLEAQVAEHARQRDELGRQLTSLRQTLGVRILSKYWSWVRRALPPGTRRRRAAASLRRLVFGKRGVTLPGSGANGRGATPPPAPMELQAFLQRDRGSTPPHAALILSPTLLDLDEGQRSTHLACELARRGVPVVFGYWRWRADERRPQDMVERGIFQIPLDELVAEPTPVLDAFGASRRFLLVEFPHPSFFGLAAAARGRGWATIYDVVDDWKEFHKVGHAPWYDEDFEIHLLATADALVAVSPRLVEKAKALAARTPELIANGVDEEIARVENARTLERGSVTLGYFGHLTRAWFDWDLILDVARARADWRIHLIGYGDELPHHPENVILHGKVPRRELASYAANWDAAVIPFKASPLAASSDPIKLYEYLALGLPVLVAGAVPPLGTEGMAARVAGPEELIAEASRMALLGPEEAARRRQFASKCLWTNRLEQLLALLERRGQRLGLQASLFANEG